MKRPGSSIAAALAKRLGLLVLTVLGAALITAMLARLAPGFGMDERRLDLRRSESSIESLRTPSRQGLFSAFAGYLSGLARGDWGESVSLGRPVRELVRERAALTVRTIAMGLGMAWLFAFSLALLLEAARARGLELAATFASGAMLCLPTAVVALLFLYLDGGPAPAVAAILSPRLFRYARNILRATGLRPHALAASARGVGRTALLWRHTCIPAAGELLALAGVSVSMAVGAVIPVEALCDSPGVGQLVWQAATARDVPVLTHLTLLVAAVVSAGNLFSDASRALLCRWAP